MYIIYIYPIIYLGDKSTLDSEEEFKPYGLGNVRTLSQFEISIGVNFSSRIVLKVPVLPLGFTYYGDQVNDILNILSLGLENNDQSVPTEFEEELFESQNISNAPVSVTMVHSPTHTPLNALLALNLVKDFLS
jgi:hypothetical protein